ncbi:MAG: tRNA epoxyqueuosine(34) reductase QueG [Bacteroides sp.]|jgi:epoxyqueuosine reductase|nr:tRNA epoxyqueuosine(34) reductase QueG [Bacteroides sp.]
MEGYSPKDNAEFLKQEALKLGFSACGIASAEKFREHKQPLKSWLSEGMHGAMGYMENHLEKRLDPRLLVPGARSVVVVALNYFPPAFQHPESPYIVSKYAYGKDYHFILKEKLQQLLEILKKREPAHQGRVFTDSAPVLERGWAVKAGLGWTGKNGCLIIPRKGSFFFLGELITNIELQPDIPFEKDLCGNCTLCMEACPTGALISPGKLDARKCISYLTIELKSPVPEPFRGKMKGRIFGCDICQDVCPHNRFAVPTDETGFLPLEPIRNWKAEQWENMEPVTFNQMVKKAASPMGRVTYSKIMDNISAAGTPERD